ncbi:hypothetical protein N9N97_02825, partial [Rickettsiaceae bacterium]|nr:hypothetical protein [Rickettsiaceae bacterium]
MGAQVTLAIHHGARVTEEVQKAAADKGLGEVLLNAIADKPAPKKVYRASEKMKVLLEMMVRGTDAEEVEEVLGAKSVRLFKSFSKKPSTFKMMCKIKQVDMEEKKDGGGYEYKAGQVVNLLAPLNEDEVDLSGATAAAPEVADLD